MRDFGDLRSALHATPSEEAWEDLLEHFDALEDAPAQEVERALEYATAHLDRHWPDRLRTIPLRWLTALQGLRDAGVPSIYYSAPAPHTERIVQLARKLFLSNRINLMGAADIEELHTLGHLLGVTQIEISGLSFTRENALMLAEVINQGKITGLSLERVFPGYRNNVSEDPSRAFFEALAPGPGQLERLALVNLSQSVNDLSPFLRKYELEGLEQLDLRHNILTDPMLEQLCRAPLAATLESLALSDNFFTQAGLDILEDPDKLPALKKLIVRELPLSLRAERALDARGVEVERFDQPIAMRALVSKRGGLEREIYMPATTTIGRGHPSTILLNEELVSKSHAVFTLEQDMISVSDAASGAIYVDSSPIQGKAALSPENSVTVGSQIFTGFRKLQDE